MKEIKQRITQLRELIHYYNNKYFNENVSEISDETYDQLFKELKELEEQCPQYTDINSPTQTVGASVTENALTPVKHEIPMLSLGKVHSYDEFNKWLDKRVADGVVEYFAELKMDGLAINLDYEDGDLIVGATRGDGKIGDDVTATTRVIKDTPNRIVSNISGPLNAQIRGEVYLRKSKLEELNILRILEGKKKYENVRNAASGILRRKEVDKEKSFLSFAAYGIEMQEGNDISTYSDALNTLVDLGVPTASELGGNALIRVHTLKDAQMKFAEFFKYIESIRNELDYEIDGIVIKANKYDDQKRLGSKANAPEWATAYKFTAQSKTTKFHGVEWTMGNKGNITPNAIIEPVVIGGTTVVGPTLHNLEELKRLELMVGDTVVVSRRGDVIPKVEGVIKDLRTGEETPIEIPSECPSCGSPTIINGAYLRCSAGVNCNYMTFAKIQNFVQALEIDGFGPKVIEKILEHGFANDLVDIFDLKVEQLETVERMGKRSATKLVNNIQAAKEVPYEKILMGMTIPGVGSSTSEDLVEKYGEPINLLNLLLIDHEKAVSELSLIDGIAEKSANKLLTWLRENQDTLVRLHDKEIGKQAEVKVLSSSKLEGKSFCFTGKLSNSRPFYEQLVIDNGGKVDSVKKGLSYLVAGDKAGSKISKVDKFNETQEIKTQIIDEDTFMNMIK